MNISNSLLEKAMDKPEFQAINVGNEVGITFPYYEFYISIGPLDYIPPFLNEAYEKGMEVWASENMPQSWKDFFNEILKLREERGIKSPISPFSTVMMMIENDANLEELIKKQLCIEGEIFLEEVIMNPNLVKDIFNFFLEREDLKSKLKNQLIDFMYYHSATWVDTYEIEEFITKIGLENGVILDVGCGVGDLTNSLSRNNKVIGLDKQYYPSRFGEEWNNHPFTQANAENMPFRENSFDLVTMTSVVGHLDTKAIDSILNEISRVLKMGGYLVIGPQNTGTLNSYRYFQKGENQMLTEVS